MNIVATPETAQAQVIFILIVQLDRHFYGIIYFNFWVFIIEALRFDD